MPAPFVDTVAAERLFRHEVIALLRDEGLLSEERIALLLSWRSSRFSVHNGVTIGPAVLFRPRSVEGGRRRVCGSFTPGLFACAKLAPQDGASFVTAPRRRCRAAAACAGPPTLVI
jgi:hypothetical protein